MQTFRRNTPSLARLARAATSTAAVVPGAVLLFAGAVDATVINWNVSGFTNGPAPNTAPGTASNQVPGAGAWNTSAANWTTGAVPPFPNASTTTYTDGGVDDVRFNTGTVVNHPSSPATITVQAGGVTPLSLRVTGTTTNGGNYVFTGGSINGNTSFVHEAPHNTGGIGPIVFLQAANAFNGGIELGTASAGSVLESQINGSFGSGAITFKGGASTAGSYLRFGGPTQSHSNDLIFSGTGASSQRLYGGSTTANTRVTMTGSITGNDDTLFVTGPAAAKVIELRPGGGETISGTGNITISNGILSISNPNQLFTGNLNLVGGNVSTLVLDNMSWATFGRTQGNGAGQWNIAGGAAAGADAAGFAARGQDVTIDNGTWDRSFSLGYGDISYADRGVRIQTGSPINLTAARTIRLFGGTQALVNSTYGLNVLGPVHEIADAVTGGQALTLIGSNSASTFYNSREGGNLRFSNVNNNISSISIGNAGTAAAIFTSDAAFGGATVNVGTVSAGGGGLLMFEDATPGFTGTTFTKGFTVGLIDTSGNINYAGFGSYAGNVTWTGTGQFTSAATMTAPGLAGGQSVPVIVQSGSMTMGTASTPATLDFDRALNYASPNFNGAIYNKSGSGEVVLRNITYTGNNPALANAAAPYRWQILGGTLTSESASMVTSGDLRLPDMLGPFIGGASAVPLPLNGRRWKVAVNDHTYSNVVGGTWLGNPTVEVGNGLTLTTTLTTATPTAVQSLTPGTSGAQTLFKTGGGTWVLNSPAALAASGDTTDMLQVDAGTLDVRGNTGNAGFAVSGGALLSADVSGFVTGRTLTIDTDGGKIGISRNAAASVARSAAINTWTQGGTVTFASRNDFSLQLTNAALPDITAGTVLFERDVVSDLTPTGVVQINDTAVAVSGSNTRVGGSGVVRFGATGTGDLTFNDGTLAPGSSPGILTIEGDVALTSSAVFEVELDGVVAGTDYDQLVLSSDANRTIALGSAELSVLLGYAAANGDTFTIIENLRASGGTSGLFSYGGNPLNEGDAFTTTFNANPYGFTISYAGGSGNDVVLTSTGLVPEPAGLAALALGSLPLVRRRRRRA